MARKWRRPCTLQTKRGIFIITYKVKSDILCNFAPSKFSYNICMNKIKSVSKFVTSFNRVNTYDDTIEETKRLISYTEFDANGNICCDKSYDALGECENIIHRVYDSDSRLIEESFYDGIDSTPYESKKYKLKDNGLPCECKVTYSEEEVMETYIYSDKGNLIEKRVSYSDGYNYCENKYVWDQYLLLEEIEYDDEDSINVSKKYTYDQQQRLIAYEVNEFSQDNKISETYAYGNYGIEKQITYNLKGEVMSTRSFVYDENGLLLERVIETQSQFMKYVYTYNDNKLPITESMLNREDTVLSRREFTYNENMEEVGVNVYSLNIVDNNDELLLVETYSTEYEYY